MDFKWILRLFLAGHWRAVVSIFGVRVNRWNIQWHSNGTATHTNAIFWFGFSTQKKIYKSSLPKYGSDDSIPLHDVDNDCETEWCLWAKAQNKNAYMWLNKYNRKVQS